VIAYLPLVMNDGEFRTNLGVGSWTDSFVLIRLELQDSAGAVIDRQDVWLPPFGHAHWRMETGVTGGTVAVWILDGPADAMVYPYASVVNETTGDPVNVEAQLTTVGLTAQTARVRSASNPARETVSASRRTAAARSAAGLSAPASATGSARTLLRLTPEMSAGRPCIVVADGETGARTGLAGALREVLAGATIVEMADGRRAWELLATGTVDVLLADAAMPGCDGVELARRARGSLECAATYIILLSGGPPSAQLLESVDHLVDECLVKPLKVENVAARVRTGLRHAAALRRVEARVGELEELYSRQGEYLSWVSHEIRTPLSAILSSANILLRYGDKRPEAVERFAKVILGEGRRLTRMINNLLDLAKIEAGKVEWHFAPTQVNGVVEQVRESFSALAGERNLQLDVAFCDGTADIVADRDKLTQVLVNLVANAIKHSPEGGMVFLRCGCLSAGGIRFEVEDQGPGIPAGQEERVFDRFRRLENGEEKGGTGLGLTISRQIVEHHGGRIWAEPGRSFGALFVVELPNGPARRDGDGPVR
jgi:signal transduction histidine kinase